MSRCRVVVPETVRIPLSDGDWIDVKRELNAAEYLQQIRDMGDRKTFVKILAYVLAWSMIGPEGTALPWDPDADEAVRRAAVGALDKGTIREMIATLDRHEATQDAVLEAKKKTPSAAPASTPTSTSPDAVAGPSTPSAP
jgi:hypothetical protein